MENILNALFSLTVIEQERELNPDEIVDYLYYVELLNKNGVPIPFGIEI